MGNKLVVENATDVNILINIHFAGDEENCNESTIPKNSISNITLPRQKNSDTVIISVNNLTFRAVKKNSQLVISKNSYNSFQIDISIHGKVYSRDSNNLFNYTYHWNISDTNREELVQNINNTGKFINSICDTIGQMFGMGVLQAVAGSNNNMIKQNNKLICGAISAYLKVPLIKSKNEPFNSEVYLKINQIYHLLVSINRALSTELKFYENDRTKRENFLTKLIHHITLTDYLPFLESCGFTEAIPVYLYAISTFLEISDEFSKLNEANENNLAFNYCRIFIDNFDSMIEEVLDNVTDNVRIKHKNGLIMCKSELIFDGIVVYIVKSCRGNLVRKKINDIKDAFIKNRKYQLEMSLGNPREFLAKIKPKVDDSNGLLN